MIGKTVSFLHNGSRYTGEIMDKVNVPIASGTNEYCPMDNYVIAAENGSRQRDVNKHSSTENKSIYIVNQIMISIMY